MSSAQIPDIFNMIPNIKLLIIRNGYQGYLKGGNLKYVNSINSIKLLEELKIYKYSVNPDDLSKLKTRGVKIFIRN